MRKGIALIGGLMMVGGAAWWYFSRQRGGGMVMPGGSRSSGPIYESAPRTEEQIAAAQARTSGANYPDDRSSAPRATRIQPVLRT